MHFFFWGGAPRFCLEQLGVRIVLLREFVAHQKTQAITKVLCRVSPLICQDDAVSADIYVEISKFADSMEEPFLKKMLQDF